MAHAGRCCARHGFWRNTRTNKSLSAPSTTRARCLQSRHARNAGSEDRFHCPAAVLRRNNITTHANYWSPILLHQLGCHSHARGVFSAATAGTRPFLQVRDAMIIESQSKTRHAPKMSRRWCRGAPSSQPRLASNKCRASLFCCCSTWTSLSNAALSLRTLDTSHQLSPLHTSGSVKMNVWPNSLDFSLLLCGIVVDERHQMLGRAWESLPKPAASRTAPTWQPHFLWLAPLHFLAINEHGEQVSKGLYDLTVPVQGIVACATSSTVHKRSW